jgi:CheY-like chemotaxis protein/HPt (histidine-containing phosphotransfer) domain-containing protein
MDKQLSLLLAEDDLISRRLIRILIEKLGHKVNDVDNGEKAFEAFKKNHYDIILMDIQMPVMDGLECTRKIREYEKEKNLSKVTVIAVTAHAMKGDKEKCLNAGIDDYITKPIEEKVLLNKINKHRINTSNEMKIANIEKLHKLLENSTDVGEIVSDFLDYYPHQLLQIKEIANSKEYEELANSVHKMKGSVTNFDAEQVLDTLKRIETYAKNEDQVSIEKSLIKLEEQLEVLKTYLQKHTK